MIKLSTKGRYGSRLMLNLARHYDGSQAIILKNVSRDENISIRYLEQIIIPLKINKLVKSIRGAGGGYKLARKPSEIRISEILQALEGACCLVDCVDDEEYCERLDFCATFEIWKGASLKLREYFDSFTLEDLAVIHDKKQKRLKRKKSLSA